MTSASATESANVVGDAGALRAMSGESTLAHTGGRTIASTRQMSRAKPAGLLVTEPMRIEPKRVGYRGDRALVDRIENEDRLVGSGVGEFVQVVVQFA